LRPEKSATIDSANDASTAYRIVHLDNRILFSRYFPDRIALADRQDAHEKECRAVTPQEQCWVAPDGGDDTGQEDNDTSVIRGPAIMKAGRLDSYEAASQARLGEIPDFQGIRENIGRTIL
jgi:hypothetical protein